MVKTGIHTTVDQDIMDLARQSGINISEAAEAGIRDALRGKHGDVKTMAQVRKERRKAEAAAKDKKRQDELDMQKMFARGDYSALIPNGTPVSISRLKY